MHVLYFPCDKLDLGETMIQSDTKVKRIIRATLWVVIAAGFLFTRLYRLDSLPGGLHIDEAGAAYDAWSLANFGVDRYRTAWPVYLANYGKGQSILLAYTAAFLIKLFGGTFNVWFIRLPETLFSAFTLIFGVKLAREMFGRDTFYPEITGFILVFAPYFIMQCRFGYDCNLMLGASMVFLYFFTMGIRTQKARYYILSGLSAGLMLYTYVLSHMVLPVFLIISAIYLIAIGQFKIKKWLMAGACLVPFAVPLIYFHIVNRFRLPARRFLFFTISKIPTARTGELGLPGLKNIKLIFKNMFIGDGWPYDCVKGYPPLTYAAIPLCTIGAVSSVVIIAIHTKKKQASPLFPVFAWLLSSVLLFFCAYSEVYRANFIYGAMALTMVAAVYASVSVFIKVPKKKPGNIIAGLLFTCFLIQAGMFFKYYFTGGYEKDNPNVLMFSGLTGKACEYVMNDAYLSSRTTYTSGNAIFYLLESGISPYSYEYTGSWGGELFGIGFNKVSPNEAPDDNINYIIPKGVYTLYQNRLRTQGFTAVEFPECYLYYK